MEEACVDCSIYSELNGTIFGNDTENVTRINKFYFYQGTQLAILWVLLAAIVAGNATVVLALFLTKARKSRMNFFIMQLAIADLWVGLISVLPDLVHRITIAWYAGSIMCKLMKYLQGVVTYSSTYVLVALSVDRCDAITHPMRFTGSWRRARALIVGAWVLSFLFCMPMLFLFDEANIQGKHRFSLLIFYSWSQYFSIIGEIYFDAGAIDVLQYGVCHLFHNSFVERPVLNEWVLRCRFPSVTATVILFIVQNMVLYICTPQCWSSMNQLQWQIWMTTVFLSLFVAPALTIAACYGVILIKIQQKSRRVISKRAASRQSSDDLDSRRASSRGIIPKAKIKTVKMTFVIVFVFVLCWSPYMIFDLLQVYGYVPNTQVNIAIASLIQSLAPLNSAANPVIYFIFSNRIFISLRNIPPYKWLWCIKTEDTAVANESRAHTEMLTSSHRRTRHELTIRIKDNGMKNQRQRLHQYNGSSRKVRMNLPKNQMQTNNNCHHETQGRPADTFL